MKEWSSTDFEALWKEGIATLRTNSWLFVNQEAVALSFADTKDHDENGTDATRPVRKDLVDITKCCNFNSRRARYDARLPLLFNVKGCRLGWQAVENAAMSPIKSDPKFPNDMIFSVGVELSKLPNPFLRVFASLAAPAVDLIDGRTVGEWTETIRKSLKGRFLVNVGKHTFDSAVLAEEMDLEEGEEVDLVGGESTPLEGATWSVSDPYDLGGVTDTTAATEQPQATALGKPSLHDLTFDCCRTSPWQTCIFLSEKLFPDPALSWSR